MTSGTTSRSRTAEEGTGALSTAHLVLLDTEHDGLPGAIGAWWIEGPEPILIDPGPSPSLANLERAVAAADLDLNRLRHLALTHVHLDHAGAAGHLTERFPHLKLHLHRDGARYLTDPERLIASTRRTFGEGYDRLFGEVKPIPADRISPIEEDGTSSLPKTLRALPSPGHIDHHLAFLDERSGTLFSGDALGLRLAPDAPVCAPTPPPSVDLVAWTRTLDRLEQVGAERLAPTHFGLHPAPNAASGDPAERAGHTREMIREFRTTLERLTVRVEMALAAERADRDAALYDAEVRDELTEFHDRGWVDRYFDTFSAENDYRGMRRYLERNPDWRAEV